MTTLNSSEARSHFYGLLAQVNDSHQPITITGKNGNADLWKICSNVYHAFGAVSRFCGLGRWTINLNESFAFMN